MVILRWAALSVSPLISEESRQWKDEPPTIHTHSIHHSTYGHAPRAECCSRWEREVSPEFWSRVSTLQRQNPGHTDAQRVDLLLWGKHTAHRSIQGWLVFTQTHTLLPLSNASLRLLISIWEPGTRNIPSWWRPGRQIWLCGHSVKCTF